MRPRRNLLCREGRAHSGLATVEVVNPYKFYVDVEKTDQMLLENHHLAGDSNVLVHMFFLSNANYRY